MAACASVRSCRTRTCCCRSRVSKFSSVLFCDTATTPPPTRRPILLETEHAAAREAILGACSRRKLGPLLVALGGGHQVGLPFDDEIVTKGEPREVSRDRHSLGYIVVSYVAQQLNYEPHFSRKVSQNQALARA